MTCRYSTADWRDSLYTSVRQTPGGVADAAQFLTNRRGKSIHAESLRAKLRGVEGESLSIEFADLLTEWMQEKNRPDALDWLHALNAQHGLSTAPAEVVAPEDMEPTAILHKGLKLGEESGILARIISHAMADLVICNNDLDAIVTQIRKGIRLLNRLEAMVRRAAGKGAK